MAIEIITGIHAKFINKFFQKVNHPLQPCIESKIDPYHGTDTRTTQSWQPAFTIIVQF